MKKRLRSYVNVFLAMIILTLGFTLSGCSSKASGVAPVMETAAAAAQDAKYDSEFAQEAMAPAPPMAAGAGGLTTDYAASAPIQNSRKLIRTVDLEAETTDFDNLLSQLTKKVAELGGYMEDSRIDGSRLSNKSQPVAKMAVITARVPADKLDQLVTEVESNSNIVSKVESTKDVTLEYADIESMKKSLKIEQDRVWMLLEKAEDMETILSLESHLTEIRYQLESMESQLRLFDNQVSYSTVQLTIQEVLSLTPEPLPTDTNANRLKSGFKNNMRNVTNGLINLSIGLITNIPYIIVLAVVVLVIFLIYRFMQRGTSGEGGEKKNKSLFKKSDADKLDKGDNKPQSPEQ